MRYAILIYFISISFFIKAQSTRIVDTEEALARQYFQQEQYEKVIELLEKRINNQNKQANNLLYINSLSKLNKEQVLEKFVHKLIQREPQNIAYPLALGNHYQDKGKISHANKVYDELISKIPANEFLIRDLSNAFLNRSNYDYSIKTLEHGQKIFNDPIAFKLETINIYRYTKNKDLMIHDAIDLIIDKPELLFQVERLIANSLEEHSDYLSLQSILLKRIQKSPDSESLTSLLIWNYIQLKDFDMALRQLIAFDRRFKLNGQMIFEISRTFIENKAYTTAIKAFEYIIAKGIEHEFYLVSKIELLNCKYLLHTTSNPNIKELHLLAIDYEKLINEYGRNNRTLFAIKRLAELQAYYLNEALKAEENLYAAIRMPGIAPQELGQLKLDLGDINILIKQPWEAILLYEQVNKQFEDQTLGNEARFKSAKLSFYQGNFKYSNAQCEILKAATSQLIANDALNLSLLISENTRTSNDSLALQKYASTELLNLMKRKDQALIQLDSINLQFPNNSLADAILMSKAKIYIEKNEPLKAVVALQEIEEKFKDGIWSDDALYMLGDIYNSELNNTEKANYYYQKLIIDYPGSMYIGEARKKFRSLRGDDV